MEKTELIQIKMNMRDGKITASLPTNPMVALWMLEAAKGIVAGGFAQAPAPESKIEVVPAGVLPT